MKIGLLSDTHNNVTNTQAALDIFRAQGIITLLHCGDITRPQLVSLFAGWDVTFVLGNVDEDVAGLSAAARAIGAPPPRPMYTLTLNGTTIALVHGQDDEALQALIESQQYRWVFHGHTHRRRDERVRRTRVVNPGALGGRHIGPCSAAIVDLSAEAVTFIEIAG